MVLHQRYGKFKIVLTDDGCWRKDLTTIIPTLSAVRRTMRELIRMGYTFDNLALMDVKTGRYLSMVL